MASIFEEMMSVNHDLTESAKISHRKNNKVVKENRKISYKKLKVESRKFFEENDITDLEKDFEIPEEDSQDEVVLVIDPEISDNEEIPEDAAEEMVGDLVYKCPVCGSNYVCDCNAEGMVEGVEVDEEGAPLECPICGDDADQILVGEIAPAGDAPGEEKSEMEPLSTEESEDDTEDSGEFVKSESLRKSLKEGFIKDFFSRVNTEDISDIILNPSEFKDQVNYYREDDYFDDPSQLNEFAKYFASSSEILMIEDESVYDYPDLTDDLEELLQKLDSEFSARHDRIEIETATVIFDKIDGRKVCRLYGDGMWGYFVDVSGLTKNESLRESEDYDKDDETPLELEIPANDDNKKETPQVVVKDSDVNLYFDEAKLEALMRRMMKEDYKGTPQFKVNKVTLSGKKLKIEYVVRNGKRSLRGLLVGEGFSRKSRAFKLMLRDKGAFTESFARTPSFTVECVRMRNKIIPTRMDYNYRVKVNESLYCVKGSISGTPL